jgi:hypothetical protein
MPQQPTDLGPALLDKRISYLKENIRLRNVFEHFGVRYRTHGNMLCPLHDERNPSSRFYDDQDTSCNPEHGVDQVEFVVQYLGLEGDGSRGYAVLKAVEYLESAFGLSYTSTPWEARLATSLRRQHPPHPQPDRYWRSQHKHLLRLLASTTRSDKWTLYADLIATLTPLKAAPITEQAPIWRSARATLAST